MCAAKDPLFEAALLAKRLEFLRDLRTSLSSRGSLAGQTVAIYSDVLDELVFEVALEVHRAVKTGQALPSNLLVNREAVPPPSAVAPVVVKGSKGVVDAFGQLIPAQPREEVSCSNCGRRIAASRFAPHLEKCLGRGRNGRATSRKLTG